MVQSLTYYHGFFGPIEDEIFQYARKIARGEVPVPYPLNGREARDPRRQEPKAEPPKGSSEQRKAGEYR